MMLSAYAHHTLQTVLQCSELDTLDSEIYSIIKDRQHTNARSICTGYPFVWNGPPWTGVFFSRLPKSWQPQSILEDLGFESSSSILPVDSHLVELIGIEPTTSGLQSPRSPS